MEDDAEVVADAEKALAALRDRAAQKEIEALLDGNVERAVDNLRHHLQCARERTLQRLKVLSVLPEPALPAYLIRLS